MVKNIFKGAKVGDKMLKSDGSFAIIVELGVVIRCVHPNTQYTYPRNVVQHTPDGCVCSHHTSFNIVGRWREPIDEKKLNNLAEKEFWIINDENLQNAQGTIRLLDYEIAQREAYKKGYRKAKEE